MKETRNMFWTRLGHGLAAGAAVDRENRLAGLGPLAGIATGTAVGVTAAFT